MPRMPSLRRALAVLAAALVGCGSPAELDPDGDPDAFWAWCTDAGRGRAFGGDATVADLDDLALLAGVSLVNGDLVVTSATLVDLTGLEDLRCVRGDLIVDGNAQLVSLAGLDGLVAIGGSVVIRDNLQLADLSALGTVRHVAPFGPGEVAITSNAALPTLRGLEGIEVVHGDLDVQANAALVDVHGLDGVYQVDGDVAVRTNARLVDLDGLGNLGSVGGALRVENGDALEDVGLGLLRGVDLDDEGVSTSFVGVQIQANPALRTVRLGRLEQARTIEIERNEALEAVDLAALVRVDTDYPVAGSLTVVSEALATITLDSLESVRGDLRIDGPNLDAFVAPRLVRVDGDFAIGDDAVFPTRAPALSTLNLASLATVEEGFRVRNTALADLSGVPALVSVGRELVIEHNQFLSAIVGLTELASARSLAIASNRSLPNCEALAVEDRLRAAGFTGSVRIAANDETATCP